MKRISLVLAASFALASCGGGGGGSSIAPAAALAPAAPAGAQGVTTFTYGADALTGAQYIGPATGATMGVDVELTPQNAAGLETYAAAVSNPHSAQYRHFLTPTQIGQTYGATTANVNAVAKYFASYHLHVGTWPQHLSLFVAGSETQLGQAFGTTFGIYQQGGKQFIAPTSTPHFSQTLAVTGVTHLVTAQRSFLTLVPTANSTVTATGYTPQQIRNVFDYTSAYSAGYTGSGITIGIVGTGPISSADVPAYGSMFDTNVAPVTQVDVTDTGVATPGIESPPDTGFQTPPPTTTACGGTLPDCNPEDIEAQLDTEAAASLAPGSNVDFYIGYDPSECETSTGTIVAGPCASGQQPLEGIEVSDDEIQQVIADDTVDVLSLSYGGPEQANAGYEFSATTPDQGLGPEEFAALAAEGIAVFVSSGDSGAEGCQRPEYTPDLNSACVSYPATDPSVTSVGGVTAPLDQFGNLTNQIIGWGYSTGQGDGGSGGGVSAYFASSLTPWQVGPGVIAGFRNQPDVSVLGDPETGMAVLAYASLGGPLVEGVGGTSVAAPEMAAMWALVLQACKQSSSCATAQGTHPYRLGNAAPLLYSLYATSSTATTPLPTYAQTFYDVVYGNNSQTGIAPSPGASPLDPGYNAGPGYDQVTGLGVPFARALIKAVTNQ